MEKVKIADIKPASYNPRKISAEGFENLKASLKTLGVIKPIIVRAENKTIIAGHQRTKAMTAVGITEVDAFIISGVNQQDEARFNQFHNRCEYELNENAPKVKINAKLDSGYNIVEPKDIEVLDKGRLASINNELCRLIVKYGEFGCPICNTKGDVEISSAYAFASKNTNKRLRVLVLPDEKIEIAKYYFSKDYGQFNYEGIERKTYIQALAQMNRLRPVKGRTIHSVLYEKHVIPFCMKDENRKKKYIDFGAGHYAYAEMMRDKGFDFHFVDPYHRIKGMLNITENTKGFLKICSDIDNKGLYDVVICDSVLNSIDKIQSWYDVIYTCYALLKEGRDLFISGRPRLKWQDEGVCKEKTTTKGYKLYFCDENGLTAQFRQGQWFFQKFDDEETIKKIVDIFGMKLQYTKNSGSYQLHLKKVKTIPLETYLPSIMREFDMMLPNGKHYGLQEQIRVSLLKHHAKNENKDI